MFTVRRLAPGDGWARIPSASTSMIGEDRGCKSTTWIRRS
jgi:hypothetical protein